MDIQVLKFACDNARFSRDVYVPTERTRIAAQTTVVDLYAAVKHLAEMVYFQSNGSNLFLAQSDVAFCVTHAHRGICFHVAAKAPIFLDDYFLARGMNPIIPLAEADRAYTPMPRNIWTPERRGLAREVLAHLLICLMGHKDYVHPWCAGVPVRLLKRAVLFNELLSQGVVNHKAMYKTQFELDCGLCVNLLLQQQLDQVDVLYLFQGLKDFTGSICYPLDQGTGHATRYNPRPSDYNLGGKRKVALEHIIAVLEHDTNG